MPIDSTDETSQFRRLEYTYKSKGCCAHFVGYALVIKSKTRLEVSAKSVRRRLTVVLSEKPPPSSDTLVLTRNTRPTRCIEPTGIIGLVMPFPRYDDSAQPDPDTPYITRRPEPVDSHKVNWSSTSSSAWEKANLVKTLGPDITKELNHWILNCPDGGVAYLERCFE
jgi:hypothetical protein